MSLCSEVKDYFKDPSTHLHHPCSYVCYTDNPKNSPVDCQELCPEYYECLIEYHYGGERSTTTVSVHTPIPATLPTSEAHIGTPYNMTLIVLVSLAAVAVVLVTVALVIVKCKRKNQVPSSVLTVDLTNRQEPQSLESCPLEHASLITSPDQSSHVSIHNSSQVHYSPQRHHTGTISAPLVGTERLSQEESIESGRSALVPSGSRSDSDAPLSLHSQTGRHSGSRLGSFTHRVSIATQTFPVDENAIAGATSPSLIHPNVIKEEPSPVVSYPVQETCHIVFDSPNQTQEELQETVPKNM